MVDGREQKCFLYMHLLKTNCAPTTDDRRGATLLLLLLRLRLVKLTITKFPALLVLEWSLEYIIIILVEVEVLELDLINEVYTEEAPLRFMGQDVFHHQPLSLD